MNLLIALIFIPLITGLFLYAYGHYRYNALVFPVQVILSVLYAALLHAVFLSPQHTILYTLGGWSPNVGIQFKLDSLSMLFSGMTIIAFWYIWLFIWQNRKEDQKFIFFLCVLQSTMLGLFTNNDLFTFFVMAETMTAICAILITYKRDAFSVRSGLYYLFYNSWGMILYLMGILWLYQIFGSFNINNLLQHASEFSSNQTFQFGMVFVFAGIAIKSAFFPVFIWLPPAHSAAPASISALLSGIIAKTGLFMLLRLSSFASLPNFSFLLICIGITSGLIGALGAMLQSDMKRILAFHTISQIGLITVAIGIGGSKAEFGAMLHIFNHFLFKSLLFLSVGLIVQETGERRVKKITGLWHWHKGLSLCLIIGILGIIGFPYVNGSLSKLFIKASSTSSWITVSLLLINLGTFISFIKLGSTLMGNKSECLQTNAFKATLSAPLFVSLLTLFAFPSELLYTYYMKIEFFHLYMKKSGNDILIFVITALCAVFTYQFVFLPLQPRVPKFIHNDLHFGHGISLSILTVAGLLLYMST